MAETVSLKEAVLFIITQETLRCDFCYPERVYDVLDQIGAEGNEVDQNDVNVEIEELLEEKKVMLIDDDPDNPYLLAVRKLYKKDGGEILVSLTISNDEIPDDIEWSEIPSHQLH